MAVRMASCCLLALPAASAEQKESNVAGAGTDAEDTDAEDVARQHFTRALVYVDDGAFGLAISEFERAYRAHPHPSVLYNLGLAYARAGDPVRATETLERYLAETDEADSARRAAVEAVLNEERAKVGEVIVLTSPDDARVRIGDRDYSPPHGEAVRLLAREWTVLVTSDGYAPSTLSLPLAPGEHRLVQVALAPEVKTIATSSDAGLQPDASRATEADVMAPEWRRTPASSDRTRTVGYVTAATGLAALATGVAFYVVSSNEFGTWQDRQRQLDVEWQRGRPFTADLAERQGRNDELARDVAAHDRWALGLGVGGGVLVAVSLPLLLWTGANESTGELQARGDGVTWRTTW